MQATLTKLEMGMSGTDSIEGDMRDAVPRRGSAALLRERLAEMARLRGPGARLPTVRELCMELETTPATLNLALARLEQEGVLRRRQGSGIFVAPDYGRRRVALVCDPAFFGGWAGVSPFWNILVERVRERARVGNEDLSFHFALPVNTPGPGALPPQRSAPEATLPLHEGLAAAVRDGRVQGALGIGLSEAAADWLAEHGVPLVSFAGAGRAVVGIDHDGMIPLLVGVLAGQGCRNIELWSPVASHRPVPASFPADYQHNREAFARALAAAGLPFDAARHRYRNNSHLAAREGAVPTVSHVEQGYDTAFTAFGPGTPPGARPDGIAVLDDMMALGALQALQQLGVRVGRDVRIATHANAGSPALLGWEDRLTCAEVDPGRLVEKMFALLEAMMEGQEPEERRVLLQPTLHPATGA